jgi:hypothetical protein
MILEECSIIQIIPADGWKAVWKEKGGEGDDAETFYGALVCWALVEAPDGQRFITGLDAQPGTGGGFVAGDENFVGYVSPKGDRQEGRAPLLE